ncbi:hypothetical protein BLA29_005488 [Euroglyphus maynei]|uniref:CWH43-like N-terminal domain-containing protein n=1 Tax=Euroglyphus maynei TaxID=6958 RepID=A0A1Y3B9D6_EURMA|nr:hypothetical protein BLA29_005488 [Euroglyphus maynei]
MEDNSQLRFDQKCWSLFINNVAIFAQVLAILIIFACFVPYAVSVHFGLVPTILPYISDAATFIPAAGFFSQLLDTIVMLGAIVCIARFKQIRYYLTVILAEQTEKYSIDQDELSRLHLENFLSLSSYGIAGIGMVMIGNFPVMQYIFLHMVGVYLYIIFSAIHLLAMISIMRKLHRFGRLETHPTTIIVIVVILIISAVVFHLALFMADFHHSANTIVNHMARIYWTADQPGYEWHVLSCTFEFLYFLMFVPYFWSVGHRMHSFKQWDRIPF